MTINKTQSSFINFVKKLDLNIKDDFVGVDLAGIDFRGNDLCSANFAYGDLNDTNFAYAKLNGANFNFADLNGVNFTHADLNSANLTFANLSGADLKGAHVKNARFGYNVGISQELKLDLIQRGAIFEEHTPVLNQTKIAG